MSAAGRGAGVGRTMRAVVLTRPGPAGSMAGAGEPAAIELRELPVPVPGPVEALIRVAAVGICGTDLHLRRGDHVVHDGDLVPGHELSGEVVEVGDQVVGLRPGDLVVADPNVPCRSCRQCQRGRSNLCERYQAVGVTRAGAAAEYVVCPAAGCVVLPTAWRDDPRAVQDAALVEPLSCAVRGIDVLRLPLAASALVYGAGTMGLMIADLLRRAGAASVAVVDPNPSKVQVAHRVGAVATAPDPDALDPAPPDREWDVVVDCTGVPAAIEDGLGRVARGGTFLQFGVAPTAARVQLDPHRIYQREITVTGSMAVLDSFARAVDLLVAGALDPEVYITHRLPLDRYAEGLEAFARGETRKVLVLPGA
ncbi:MAG TPA: zinc-dependent alcohol dehydrogenase family protein [Cellulomonas sp.]